MSPEASPTPDLVSRTRQSLWRLARAVNHLQRSQLSCGPVTVQQCYALDALTGGPLSMRALSEALDIHQSTLTRIVEKLEAKELVVRSRPPGNLRVVEAALTEKGRRLHETLETASNDLVARVVAALPLDDRLTAVRGMEILCGLLDPRNEAVQAVVSGRCCEGVDLGVAVAEGEPREADDGTR